jgi:hypothetical protein
MEKAACHFRQNPVYTVTIYAETLRARFPDRFIKTKSFQKAKSLQKLMFLAIPQTSNCRL